MVEGDGDIEQFFHQIKVDKLPDNMRPKYQLGDLLEIWFRSDDGPASYKLKGDYGLVCEILLYRCTDYDEESNHTNPFYLIEYKLLISNSANRYRYITEENLRKVVL